VPALIQAWYAGQETGNAILDVLLGNVNPSGKLPISWPRKYEDTAVYGNFGMDSYDSRKVEYVEGVFVGYRHFDRTFGTEKEVQFPFGFGLSYTTFSVSDIALSGSLSEREDPLKITAVVNNTGCLRGGQVVQAYHLPPSSAEHPIKGLAGFSKVFLDKDESQKICFSIKKDKVAHWDVESKKWLVCAGTHKIWLATSASEADKICELEVNVAEAFSFNP
jgi:beta-glucosidase